MKKIIFTQSWWSIGECLVNINVMLNYIKLLKTNSPDSFYCILNLDGPEFILENCIPNLTQFCDEYHKNNPIFSLHLLTSDEVNFKKINPYCFMYVSEFDEKIQEFFIYENNSEHPKIFDELYNHTHVINRIRHNIEVLPEHELVDEFHNSNFEIFCEFTDTNESLSSKILSDLNFYDFETIHFRWHSHCGIPNEKEIINYWIDRLSNHIDSNKMYFLSSSNPMFYKLFEERFKNCFYLDRGKYSFYYNFSQEIPTYIPSHITLPSKIQDANDYIAYLELSIICKSKKIIHVSDGYRCMISLFLWLPIIKYQIPILWISCIYDVNRIYNMNGCFYQKINEIHKNEIAPPNCMCEYSNGHFC